MNPAFPEPTAVATALLVGNELLVANDLRHILLQAGYEVLDLAESGAQARALVTQAAPTIVVLDIVLKGEETGIELGHWLSEQHIPFVYLSANQHDSVLKAAKETGAFGFLEQPLCEREVLTTLEIARYRHAQGEEARLRQLQMAVNNALVTLLDRDQLCQAMATELDKVVPFSMLSLRLALLDEAVFYWVTMQKNAAGTFERVAVPMPTRREAIERFQQILAQDSITEMPVEQGIFTGDSLDQLCEYSIPARSSRDNFGMQSLVQFPVKLKQRSSYSTIELACKEPHGFTPKDYKAVELIIPPIALALDNLLASEEIEARRRIKATELAIVNAFCNGRDLHEIAPAVAAAIHPLLPLDYLTLYQVGEVLGMTEDDPGVYRQGEDFRPLRAAEVVDLSDEQTREQWQQALAALKVRMQQPTLNVGEAGRMARASNLVPQRYSEHLGGLQSSMYVPITIQGQPQAALVVSSKVAYAYTEKDLRLLQDLSRTLSLALENLLAYERIKNLSQRLEQEKSYLVEEINTSYNFEEIVGTSSVMQALFRNIALVAPTDFTVLITGETGTGKELIARAVHNMSKRASRTMIKINCAVLPPQLIESELFGHEKGSFTGATDQRLGKFELAHGSTIFLDEIGELPLELQAKLLRVLQEKEIERIGGKRTIMVDVRIIAATNRDLQQEVAAGRFRADLYYRLKVFPLLVLPLRERPEDIMPLALHFLPRIGKKLGKPLTGIAAASVQQLQHYAWPGNIRELEHVLERAAILSYSPTLALAETLEPTTATSIVPAAPEAVRPIQDTMRVAILAALAQAGNRVRGSGGAAELLALKPTTLEARMKKLGISVARE
ncbi:sigma 54-interacting transcriptional regulator [Hymenobacter cellulosivorans]|uniref:Sigma 54-interacting transcriptional regulator n=1 Tax=Hymenobacter cellulosivorans TaxID=2932249 RepID=A0ABY4FEM0_9BACT|nr:sigma 54-interacting transcriptional regulator [Hymenobacter cellulosivorans]UOQ55134.1 sigma 54-interacting transcriptional regulator [Hymenobacter cellulosivorans]